MANNETKITITAVDNVSAALRNMQGGVEGLTATFGRASAAAGGLAAALGVGALASLLQGVAAARAQFDDLADNLQTSVEGLSALQQGTKAIGRDLSEATDGITKLTKGLLGVDQETSKAGAALKILGVEAKNADGSLKDSVQLYREVGRALDNFADGTSKVLVAQALFGKGGEKQLSLLKDLNKAGEFAAKVTAEQAAEAEAYQQALNRLALSLTNIRDAFGGQFIGPAIAYIQVLERIIAATNDLSAANRALAVGGGAAEALGGALATITEAVTVFGGNIKFTFEGIGNEIGGIAAQVAALARGDFKGFMEIGQQITEDAQASRKAFDDWEAKILKSRDAYADFLKVNKLVQQAQAGAFEDQNDRRNRPRKLDVAGLGGPDKEAEERARRAQQAYDALIGSINKKIAAEQLELTLGRQLREDEKFSLQINEQLAAQQSKLSPARQKEIKDLAETAAGLIRENEARKAKLALQGQLNQLQEEYDDARRRELETGDAILRDIIRGNEALEDEARALGLSGKALALYNVELERKRRLEGITDTITRENINREMDRRAAIVANTEAMREQADAYAQFADIGADFFANLLTNGRDAFRGLEDSLKRFAAEMVAAFAKRYFLNLAAEITGNNALGNMAGQGGGSGGNIISNIMGMFSGGGAGGGASAGSGITGNMMASMASNPLGWMAALSVVSGAIGNRAFSGNRAAQTASYLGLGMGAIVNLLTGGSKENQNFRFMQGTGGGEGLFGGIGVEGTYGFDLKGLRAVTGGLDARILRLMGGDATAGTAALAAYTQAGRRADGQPAQFAFPEGDKTAAEQIAKELLQSRYGTLFELIDKSFAAQIKSWTGTSTELQTFIESALGLFEALDGTKIKGLNIDSLRALAHAGEDLGDTMTRVAGDMASLNSMFVDDTDAYLHALSMVGAEFDALGITLPVNAESFKQLRDSLDLSTESGRATYAMLVRIAPAMQSIEQAAAQMLASFNNSMGTIFGSGFTRRVIERQAIDLVSQFQSLSGLLGGVDPLAIFKNIGANQADIEYLYNTGGPALQAVLNKILALYAQYAGLQETVNTNTQQFGQVTSQFGQVTAQVIDRMIDARAGLREWLDGLFLSDQLSPLSPMQRLEESRRQFEAMLGQAQGGSADAVAGLGGAAQTYLQIARDLFASSPAFNDIFRNVTTSVGGVAGVSSASINDRLATALPSNGTLATGAQVQSLESTVLVLINLVANGISVQDPASRQAILDLTTAVNRLNAGAGLVTQS